MTGNPDLIGILEAQIAQRGPIAFSEYMDSVLYHPSYGYYSRRDNPIGPAGDFYTASNVDPAMGLLLAGLFGHMAGQIDRFRLVELGAGTGLLARHILEARVFPYAIVERSRAMRDRQRENLAGFDVEWCDDLPGRLRGCIFSNEFFDAQPVRRFARRGDRLVEIRVASGLVEVEAEPEFPIDLPLLQEGAMADISLVSGNWVRKIGNSIEAGYHLAIDYGYLERELYARRAGTLMCYRDHRADGNPYEQVGYKDITAHVNFSDLMAVGETVGLENAGFRSQREFLVDLGLLDLMEPLARNPSALSVSRLQALKNLLLPPMMGDRFRVLVQRKGLDPTPLPGFGPH